MRDWKTTIIGALLAAVSAIAIYQQSGGDLADWKQYAIPALLALLGYLAKDTGASYRALAIFALPLLLMSCVTSQSTDAELRRAQAAIEAAEFTHSLAVVVYGPRLANPQTSPAEKLVANQIIEESRKRLATEKARLVDIQARRAASVAVTSSGGDGPPATLLLPALTEAK